MFLRMFISMQLCLLAAAGSVQADGGKLYSGTFKDGSGRAGPLKCELLAREGAKWTANFKKKAGGNDGSFNLTIDKGEPAAAPKPEAQK